MIFWNVVNGFKHRLYTTGGYGEYERKTKETIGDGYHYSDDTA